MIAAFEGWNDAGSAASQAVVHLHQAWDAEQVDELDPEEYHDFQVNRPQVATDPDGVRRITWPVTSIAVAERPSDGPSWSWCTGSSRRCAGAATARSCWTPPNASASPRSSRSVRCWPTSRTPGPIPVTATSDDAEVRAALDLDRSTYEGPTGIVGVLAHEARERGMSTLSMWAAVPHYVAHPPSPKATLALLTKIEELLGEAIDVGELPEDAEAWQNGVDELAAEDSEIAEYVQQLEEAKDTADLPEASGEAIAREFERYLRRRDKPGS